MSYPTTRRLQYAVTPAQESGATRPHLRATNGWFAQEFHWKVDSYPRAHRILQRAAPKRRHVLFPGWLVDAIAPKRARGRPQPSVIVMTKSATSHLLPVFARVDLGFERGEGAVSYTHLRAHETGR